MTIRKFWLNRPSYSIHEAAYLVCGLEPQDEREKHPQIVIKVLREMMDSPQFRGLPTWGFTVGVEFIRSWANHIGETDFFKSEYVEALTDDGDTSMDEKILIHKRRNRSELLILIYEMFEAYDVEVGDKQSSSMTALEAWGYLIAGVYHNDLIKAVKGTEKEARSIELNGGDIVDFDRFKAAYNGRFKKKTTIKPA